MTVFFISLFYVIPENCGRLAKQLEIEEVEKGIKRKNMESFTRKQSAVFQVCRVLQNKRRLCRRTFQLSCVDLKCFCSGFHLAASFMPLKA